MTYRTCPHCSSERPVQEKFCGFCGGSLPFVAQEDMLPAETPVAPPPSPQRQAHSPAVSPDRGATSYALEEYAAQYTTYCWVLMFSILGCWTVIGFFVAIWAITQQQVLRRKVAEAGYDPDGLVGMALENFWRVGRWVLVAVLFLGIVAFLSTRR